MHNILKPERLIEIVDVGSNPHDYPQPYRQLLIERIANFTGFASQAKALADLEPRKTPVERYLPETVGDGAAHTRYECTLPGMSGFHEPDPITLAAFDQLKTNGEVIGQTEKVATKKLDDIKAVEHIDFLKLDVQGDELNVLKGAKKKLAKAVVVQTEAVFMPIYKDQPTFADIDAFLRPLGFIPHCIPTAKTFPLANGGPDFGPSKQLINATFVYFRDFTRLEAMDDEQLKRLSLIAWHGYRSDDVAYRCMRELEKRKAVQWGTSSTYLRMVGLSAGGIH